MSVVICVVLLLTDCIALQASNPGQFEADADMSWMRGKSVDSIYHMVG